jgi:hypothetical protein
MVRLVAKGLCRDAMDSGNQPARHRYMWGLYCIAGCELIRQLRSCCRKSLWLFRHECG